MAVLTINIERLGQPGGRNEPDGGEGEGETQADHRQIRRGWHLGDDQFRKELLAVGKSAGGSHYGSERHESDQEKANRLVDEVLRRLVCTEKELEQRPKGDKQKIQTARMLRQQTTMTLKWIALRLHMVSCT